MEPIRFEPIYQERVWGGRRLETALGRRLRTAAPVGESWEVVDRPEAQSVVASGTGRGGTLHDLWTAKRAAVFGTRAPDTSRFPVLVKLLDAADKLSLQAHPPADKAGAMGGEPKTEMWYLLDAAPGAELFAGLRRGVTRETFAKALRAGPGVADCFHRIPVRTGDCMFVPSGRVHAIGAGCLIAEIQQNSDTTYRVYDWDRKGLDGKPRALHREESLAAIDFEDFEPGLQPCGADPLVKCPWFTVRSHKVEQRRELGAGETFTLVLVTEGTARVAGEPAGRGDWVLVPAEAGEFYVEAEAGPCAILSVGW